MKRLLTRLLRPGRGAAAPAAPTTAEEPASTPAPDHSARVVEIHAGATPEADPAPAARASAAEPAPDGTAPRLAAVPAPASVADPATAPADQASAFQASAADPVAAAASGADGAAVTDTAALADPALPAGLDPADLRERPTTRRRSALRRRLRFLRRAREVLLRDLGGLVYEAQRSGAAADALVRGKVERLTGVDTEIAALSAALGERERALVVREPGIGGVCTACGEVYGSAARFCSNCGADVTAQTSAVDAAVVAPPPAGETAPAATIAAPAGTTSTRIADWTGASQHGSTAGDAAATQAATATPLGDPSAPYRPPARPVTAETTPDGADATPTAGSAPERPAPDADAPAAAEAPRAPAPDAETPRPEQGAEHASQHAAETSLDAAGGRSRPDAGAVPIGAAPDERPAPEPASGAPATDADQRLPDEPTAPATDATDVTRVHAVPVTGAPGDEPATEVLPATPVGDDRAAATPAPAEPRTEEIGTVEPRR